MEGGVGQVWDSNTVARLRLKIQQHSTKFSHKSIYLKDRG